MSEWHGASTVSVQACFLNGCGALLSARWSLGWICHSPAVVLSWVGRGVCNQGEAVLVDHCGVDLVVGSGCILSDACCAPSWYTGDDLGTTDNNLRKKADSISHVGIYRNVENLVHGVVQLDIEVGASVACWADQVKVWRGQVSRYVCSLAKVFASCLIPVPIALVSIRFAIALLVERFKLLVKIYTIVPVIRRIVPGAAEPSVVVSLGAIVVPIIGLIDEVVRNVVIKVSVGTIIATNSQGSFAKDFCG